MFDENLLNLWLLKRPIMLALTTEKTLFTQKKYIFHHPNNRPYILFYTSFDIYHPLMADIDSPSFILLPFFPPLTRKINGSKPAASVVAPLST